MSDLEALILSIKAVDKAFIAEDSVEFVDNGSEGVGVFAKKDIEKGTVLLQIPYSQCITVEKVCANPILSPLFVDNPGLLSYPDEVLAIGLMYSHLHPEDPQCEWSNHVKTMPRSFNTTLYWSEEELAEIKDCMVFHLTNMMKRQIGNDYNSIHQPMSQNYPEVLGGIDVNIYCWALSIVYSRALDITRDSASNTTTRVIVPVLDMANHNPTAVSQDPSETLHYEEATDTIQLLSLNSLKADEECYIIYGRYSNSKLLYNYGFVMLDNPHKAIDLWSNVPPTSFECEMKKNLLKSNELTCHQSYDFQGTIRPGFISRALLATIRVIQADQDDLPTIKNAFIGTMVTLRNEAVAYVALKALLVHKMKADQGEGDRVKLGELLLEIDGNTDSSISRQRLLSALIVRVGERELLQEAVQMVTGWMGELERLQGEYIPPDALKSLPSPP